MQKNSSKQARLNRYIKIAQKTKSWHPIAKNGWIIKFSIFDGTNFLIIFVSQYTGQAIIRYFDNEDNACLFINYILELDSKQEINL